MAEKIKLHIAPKMMQSIANLYDDVHRVFLEYIDNSLDSAEDYFDVSHNTYTRKIEIIFAVRGAVVYIYDNCAGIKNIRKVVESVGDSDKKAQPWTNGQFGFGIHSFMSCCDKLEITSKGEGEATLYIPIEKKQFNKGAKEDAFFPAPKVKYALISKVEENILGIKWNGNSGTKIILSGFDKSSRRNICLQNIKDEIEKHFETLLTRKNLIIKCIDGNKKVKCTSYDYSIFGGETYSDDIKELIHIDRWGQKNIFKPSNPIKVYIKVAKGREINKKPIFTLKGRRIGEIGDTKSFRTKHRGDLWEHPNVTGYIDLGDFLEPNITRVDFRRGSRRKALYNKLFELEPLILDVVRDVNKASEKSHYRQLEDRLNKDVSGDEVNLEGGGSGAGLEPCEEITKNPVPGPIGPEPREYWLDPGNILGNEPGGSETGAKPLNKLADNPFEDSEFKGKERKRSGFNIKIDSGDPIVDAATDQPKRSELFGSEIRIYQQHPDFKERVKGFRSGKQKITQRLITYLAGEITVHYKDKFHNKMGQPEYNKSMFSGLVSFIYQFESMLSDLVNTNLSDLNG
jgi:hypothetical protein